MQALSQLYSIPNVAGLTQPGTGDQKPKCSLLKVCAAFATDGTVLLEHRDTGFTVTKQALAAAVSCASYCHRDLPGRSPPVHHQPCQKAPAAKAHSSVR